MDPHFFCTPNNTDEAARMVDPISSICIYRRVSDDAPVLMSYKYFSNNYYLVLIYMDGSAQADFKYFSDILDIIPCKSYISSITLPLGSDLNETLSLWLTSLSVYLIDAL